MDRAYHVPVLCEPAVRFLLTDAEGIYVDGTVGGAGHAEAVCVLLRGRGRLIGFDVDDEAIGYAEKLLEPFRERVVLLRANFGALRAELAALGIESITGLLLDLGVSSHQLDEADRGFSFRGDELLDMRMDRRQQFTARDVVNTYDEGALAGVLWKYGEERNSRRIARRIVAARNIERTGALREIVESAVGRRYLTKSLARVFQALRIEVNGELKSLERVLTDGISLLAPGGRLVVISYHSLEDRIVKACFRRESAERLPSGYTDVLVSPKLRILTRKPVGPDQTEAARNPRSRSAKLRAAEKVHA